MATEGELASDSDDTFVTKVAPRHLDYLRSRLIHYLSNAKDISADVLHIPGQPAQLTVSFDSKQAGNHRQHYNSTSTTNKISVRNLPPSSDREHIQMFFEYEKGQGGGAVSHVTLDEANNFAIVEFEETKAVDVVLSKRPIKMLGRTVDVEVYSPYLEHDEPLKLVQLIGLPRELVREITELTVKDLKESADSSEDIIVRDFTKPVSAVSKNKGADSFSQVDGKSRECTSETPQVIHASIARECTLVQDNGIVLYDTSSVLIPVAQLIACRPLSSENNAFSIRILRTGHEGTISLGLVPRDYEEDSQPGWRPNSVGYHADDGGIFIGEGSPNFKTKTASEGDVMSLHADLERKKIFFRKNGEQCIALDYDASNLYPCIGMHSLGEAVQIIARDVWKSNSVPDDWLVPPSFPIAKYDNLWISPKDTVIKRRRVYSGWLTLYNPSQDMVAFKVMLNSESSTTVYGVLDYKDVFLKCFEQDTLKRVNFVSVFWTTADCDKKLQQKEISRLFDKHTRKPEGFHCCKLSVTRK